LCPECAASASRHGACALDPVPHRASTTGLVLLVASSLGCVRSHEPVSVAAATGPKPGVVLVCMDTLRADAVERMPSLAGFAANATWFRDASSSSSWTAPAVATLLTGLEPAHSGVRGAFSAGAIAPTIETLAETFHDRGWSTAAFTNGGWVSPARGYAQGFDAFGDSFDRLGPEATLAEWQSRRPKDRPFFVFVHTYAAHDPYGEKPVAPIDAAHAEALRAEVRRVVGDLDLARDALPTSVAAWLTERYLLDPDMRRAVGEVVGEERSPLLWDRIMEWLDGAGRDSPEVAALAPVVERRYREGLAWADRMFSRTMAALATCDLPPETVVAVVGDHGEMLGEHGTLSHGRWVYDELLRVPVVVRAPGRMPFGKVLGSCGLVDVMPTLLAVAGVPAPTPLDGRSLVAMAAGRERGEPVVAEEERHPHHGSPAVLRSLVVRTEDAKYVLTFDTRTLRVAEESLFDLLLDPGERRPMAYDPLRVSSHGDAFCRAVSRARSAVPGVSADAPCLASVR
jgi:arylsulfatase A-like enzyme